MRRFTAALTALVMIAALLGGFAHPVAAQSSSTTYTVQPGDNLYRISLKFGVTLDALIKANGIVNANYVQVGQTLTIPGTAAPAVATASATGVATSAPTMAATAAEAVGTSTSDQGIISTNAPTKAPTATP